MRIGIAADHGGFALKQEIVEKHTNAGHEIVDFGAMEYEAQDDYPDMVVPLARAVAAKDVERGIAVCGSGVGACIAANKVKGARACLVAEPFSARQGVEDDDMNIICIGGRVLGDALAWELVQTFLNARYKAYERYQRRLDKVIAIESE
jgi:ribose 5-phosphate isomerase B